MSDNKKLINKCRDLLNEFDGAIEYNGELETQLKEKDKEIERHLKIRSDQAKRINTLESKLEIALEALGKIQKSKYAVLYIEMVCEEALEKIKVILG